MKLKRVLSFGAAAALAVCLSVPVMAESTPGEQIANVTEKPGATMEEVGTAVAAMTSVYQNSQEAVEIPASVTDQALRYFDMAEEKYAEGDTSVMAKGQNLGVTWRCDTGASVKVTSHTYGTDNGVVTVVAEAVGESAYGYSLTVQLDPSMNYTEYTVTEENGDVAFESTAKVKTYLSDNGYKKIVTFWVPHFTTYILTPVAGNTGSTESTSASTSAPVTSAPVADDGIVYYTCPACGYHNWTATEEGYRCDNCGYIESQKQLSGYGNVKGVYSPKTGTENPIKATGSDMSHVAIVVVALAVAAACGMGYAAKKSGKAE